MSTITSLVGTDGITTANSMAKINTNFSNLNTDKIETSVLDTDTTLAANSDSKVATQKATKAYVDSVGTATATTTIKGTVEIATASEVSAGTATGATGASLVVTPATLQSNGLSKVASGATSYDTSAASATQNIAHGLGIAPKFVRLHLYQSDSASSASSARIYTGTVTYSNSTQSASFVYHKSASSATANDSEHSNTFRVGLGPGSGNYQGGTITVDTTNIAIAWSKNGSPTGTVYIVWEALA